MSLRAVIAKRPAALIRGQRREQTCSGAAFSANQLRLWRVCASCNLTRLNQPTALATDAFMTLTLFEDATRACYMGLRK